MDNSEEKEGVGVSSPQLVTMASAVDTSFCAHPALPQEILIGIIRCYFASNTSKSTASDPGLASGIYRSFELDEKDLSILRTCQAIDVIRAQVFYADKAFHVARLSAETNTLRFEKTVRPSLDFVTSIVVAIGSDSASRSLKEEHDMLRTLCGSATSLRDLTFCNCVTHNSVAELIDWIVMFRYMACLRKLTKVTLRDYQFFGMSYVWVPYISHRLGIPVKHRIPCKRELGLKPKLLTLATQIRKSAEKLALFNPEEHFVDTEFLDGKNILGEFTATLPFLPVDGAGMYTPDSGCDVACSEAEALKRAEETWVQASNIRKAAEHVGSGNIENSFDIMECEHSIMRSKFEILRDFWMELKELDLVVADYAARLDWFFS